MLRCGVGPSVRRAVATVGIGIASVTASGLNSEEWDARDATFPGGGIPGALVICGGGELPDELFHRFLTLAGGAQARIVVVTTASSYADTPEIEEQLRFWRRQRVRSLHILHTRSRARADEPAFSEVLEDATGLWFVGGDQNRITSTYLGTRTEERFHRVLQRGGVIGGTSAGAAIMSRVMIEGGEEEPQLGTGLGFLPGAIVDQHFLKRERQGRLRKAVSSHPGLVGLGIDEATALVVQGTNLSVVGESSVCAVLPATERQLPRIRMLAPGDQTELLALHRPIIRRTAKVTFAGGAE